MQQFIVRTATLADLNILLSFEQEIIRAERPFDDTLGQDPINYYDLRQLIMLEGATVMVAELDSKIVGSGYALIRDAKPYLDHKKYTYLGFCIPIVIIVARVLTRLLWMLWCCGQNPGVSRKLGLECTMIIHLPLGPMGKRVLKSIFWKCGFVDRLNYGLFAL
jgi:hypothetical protein